MRKKGEASGNVIKYALIALTVIVIQLAGYKAFLIVKEKQCQTGLVKFEIDLKNLEKTVDFGAVDEREYRMPCGINRIYFIDLDKNVPLSTFNEFPIIKDSIRDKAEKNVFLMKDNNLLKSLYAGNLEFEYPYYSCLIPRFDRINFFLEGMGLKAKIIPGCNQPECTDIPINISEEKARSILAEFIDFDCEACPSNIEPQIQDFRETIENVNLYRKISYCKETGITTIEVIIKPKKGVKLKNFRFFESIPKDCIENLNEYLTEVIEGDFDVYIKNDPLIMWHFNEVKTEKVINYKLSAKLSEDCKKAIQGLGIAELLVTGEEESGPPLITGFPEKIEFNEDSTYKKRSFDLDDFVEDPDNIDKELTWSFNDNNKIEVGINNRRRVEFKPEENWNGLEKITFKVTDPDDYSDSYTTTAEVLAVNDEPVVSLTDIEMDEDTTRTLNLNSYVEDVDNDAITWSFAGNQKIDMSINNNIVTFAPEQDFFGNEEITFTASDGTVEVNKKINVKINNINDAPVIQDLPDKNFSGNPLKGYSNLFKLSDYSYDADGDSLTYEITEQTDPELVNCFIYTDYLDIIHLFPKKVKCEVKKNQDGYSDVTIQVKDKLSVTAKDTFRVIISWVFTGENVNTAGFNILDCAKITEAGCERQFTDQCNEWDRGEKTGRCGFLWLKEKYVCYDDWQSACINIPSCPQDYLPLNAEPCCASHYTSQCYDNDVYWYDSCGNLQSKKQECGSGSYNSCSGFGGWSCSGNSRVRSRTCYSQGCSGGSCYSSPWTDSESSSCGSLVCSGGSCVTPYTPPPSPPPTPPPSSGNGGGECFLAGTKISMSDGSTKPIEEIRVGDVVKGTDRSKNNVLSLYHFILGNQPIYSINSGRYFVTKPHPFMTTEGWKAIDPIAAKKWNPNLKITQLKKGDILMTNDGGKVVVENIQSKKLPYNTPIYNFEVDGDNTYYADDYLVHNKCFLEGTQVTMADGSEKDIEDVKVGEMILGQNGPNKVLGLHRPLVKTKLPDGSFVNLKIVSINGKPRFFSEDHLFAATDGGWRTINPEIANLLHKRVIERDKLIVTEMKVGDELITLDGTEKIESLEITDEGPETQLYNFHLGNDHTYYANGYLVHNKCFLEGTQVTMADGSEKNIEDVKVGEEILGQNGPNKVLGLHRPLVKTKLPDGSFVNLKIVSINGKPRFFSEDHLFAATDGGWRSINPELSNWLHKKVIERDNLIVTEMKVGDELITLNGPEKIKSLEITDEGPETQLYNFYLRNDNTYYANGYLVHNKDCIIKDTQVLLSNFSHRRIQELFEGDEVMSYNIHSSRFEPAKVVSNKIYLTNKYVSLNNNIKLSYNHPTGKIVIGEVIWVNASLLKKGDLIFNMGAPTKIISIDMSYSNNYTKEYDLRVSKNGNYFLYDGKNHYLVMDEGYRE